MEMSAPSGSQAASGQRKCSAKRRQWAGLRQRWKLLGLFEIDEQHEFYTLTCMMKEGLAAAIQNTIDNPFTVSMCTGDATLNPHTRAQTHVEFRIQGFCVCNFREKLEMNTIIRD